MRRIGFLLTLLITRATADGQAKNPAAGMGAQRSARLDFSEYDKADFDEVNEILWAALKPGTQMPAPVRNAVATH